MVDSSLSQFELRLNLAAKFSIYDQTRGELVEILTKMADCMPIYFIHKICIPGLKKAWLPVVYC